MGTYHCPLCQQDVTKAVYERITGIWQEKENQMAALKAKEKSLRAKEKQLKEKFETDVKRIEKKGKQKYEKQFVRQQQLLKKERDNNNKAKANLEKKFNRLIAQETGKIRKEEKRKHKISEQSLRMQFEKAANSKIKQENDKIQKEKRLQQNRYDQLNKQFRAMQSKSMVDLSKAQIKIKSLEEQIQKNQTPQKLGLLEEKDLLAKLQELFPGDIITNPGKCGDILHRIIIKGTEVGVIVYELKKVATFSLAHVEQAYQAKQDRRADYALLVTNARKKKADSGFFIQKGVIVIHPTGVLVLVSILREHLVSISKLKLSSEKRNQTINAVLEYIQGPTFKNGIENIIVDTIDLYGGLRKEVKDHISTWEHRLEKYRNIHKQANTIDSNVIKLLVADAQPKKQITAQEIGSITLPDKID